MSAKTCGNCKHGDIPPPLMTKHAKPRVLHHSPGQCRALAVVPMCSYGESQRFNVYANHDATKCPCWEPKGGE